MLGIHKTIEKYELGYDTPIEDIKSNGILFLLGLARALLSNCHILMIYELPQDTPESFKKKIVKYIKNNKLDKTVILFSHSDDYDEIAAKCYTVTKGKVKLNKNK